MRESETSFVATIGYVRRLGMRSLCVWCAGKREGGWPCDHGGTLPIDNYPDDLPLAEIGTRLRCGKCGTMGQADLRPNWTEITAEAIRPTNDWRNLR